jgi:hypothetical protein
MVIAYPTAPVPIVISSTEIVGSSWKSWMMLDRLVFKTDPSIRRYLIPRISSILQTRLRVDFQQEKMMLRDGSC